MEPTLQLGLHLSHPGGCTTLDVVFSLPLQALQYLLDDVSSFLSGSNTGSSSGHPARGHQDEAGGEWVGPRHLKGAWSAGADGANSEECGRGRGGVSEGRGPLWFGLVVVLLVVPVPLGWGAAVVKEGGVRQLLRSFLDHVATREAQNCAARRREDENAVTITTIHQVRPITACYSTLYTVQYIQHRTHCVLQLQRVPCCLHWL